MNRATFFATVRLDPFGGSLQQSQVDGIGAILDEWDLRKLTDLRHLAYMLATPFHEVGRTMQPVREGFKATDAEARAYVLRQHYAYAKVINGHVYYGRGLVQLTWDYNYKAMGALLGIDLLGNPDLALVPSHAAAIMFEGMLRGSFTGKKLADYFHEGTADWINARRIINGTDKAQTIAGYGKAFYDALLAAA